MVARELISEVIPVVHTSDTGQKALNWMEVFKVSHLPIVNNEEFLGLISDTDIFDMNTPEQPIGNHKLSLIKPYVLLDQHIFDIVALASRLKLTVIPVLDEKNIYKGVITSSELLGSVAKMSSLTEPGGIIILSLHHNDYSLSQISQIIESNGAKVMTLYVTSNPESTKMELTIKLNTSNLLPIIRTFERFDYEITSWHDDDDELDRFYSDRYDSLMRYLDI